MSITYYKSIESGAVYRINQTAVDVYIDGINKWTSTGWEVNAIKKHPEIYTKISKKEALHVDMFQ